MIPYTIKLASQKYNASPSQLPTVKFFDEKIHLLQKQLQEQKIKIKILLKFRKSISCQYIH